jgi:putative phosphonoacetaldehyde dehydrogenase
MNKKMYIAGKEATAEKTLDVINPYNNKTVATVPAASKEQVNKAFKIAANYQYKLTRYERQQILQKTADLLVKNKEEISDIITSELGICKQDSLYEVGRAFDVFSLTSQLVIQDDGEIFSCDLTPHGKARKIFTHREPLNTISVITPFNHPLNTVAHKIAPAIATNNCVVCKPTELTPLTALKLTEIVYEAGLPPEMISMITGWPEDIGSEFIQNPEIDMITFTGSVAVGKHIANTAGYKRTVLELGGNDPLIICNDLSDEDLVKAAELAVLGATKNSGQRCTAVKRILCQENVADKFVPLVLDRAKKIKFGDPQDMKTDMGTVVSEDAAKLFEERALKAAEDGAEVLYRPERQGALLPPIVLDNVKSNSELVVEETFGPIIPIIRVSNDLEEVAKVSNSTAFGLSSGVCTNDLRTANFFIKNLKVGTVNIWEVPGYRIEMSPFGGIKDSGLGYKEGALEAMKSYTNLKTYSLPW